MDETGNYHIKRNKPVSDKHHIFSPVGNLGE
jgi:hypothetical protein